ncbi:hypothetical protein E1176_02790 [Fulvivirga sp. RKSG066]|uniref:hypothetical protein n=1 Tax=Fulvivirga aurantia TaxID=2529383 RepID=UPI0012BC7D4F|nr:hypothetical protein [Fulvivirga aurantia]MTI19938.1 hypothetical protein [Fulvivirga aurantia]
MDSTIDLILKGHFNQLREEINNSPYQETQAEKLAIVLSEISEYLQGREDAKADELRTKLAEFIPQVTEGNAERLLKLAQKPMLKAGRSKAKKQDKKAM